jgi:hypothetical protein
MSKNNDQADSRPAREAETIEERNKKAAERRKKELNQTFLAAFGERGHFYEPLVIGPEQAAMEYQAKMSDTLDDSDSELALQIERVKYGLGTILLAIGKLPNSPDFATIRTYQKPISEALKNIDSILNDPDLI